MNPSPPTIAPGGAGDTVGAQDRELGRGRAGQQAAGRVRVLKRPRVDPPAALDYQLTEQRDVRRRAAEAGEADPGPLAGHGREPDPRVRRHLVGGHARSFAEAARGVRRLTEPEA